MKTFLSKKIVLKLILKSNVMHEQGRLYVRGMGTWSLGP